MRRPGALLAGCAGGFAVSWNIANTGALATTLADHYGVATGVIGLFAAATFLAELVEMLPAGRAIDHFGAKRSMLVAVALVIFGNLAAMAGGGIALALWWRFVTGLGVGLGFIAGSIYIRSDAHGHTTHRQGIYGGVSLSGEGWHSGSCRCLTVPSTGARPTSRPSSSASRDCLSSRSDHPRRRSATRRSSPRESCSATA